MDSDELKTTFNSIAEAYNKYRPKYPTELFDDLVSHANLRSPARLLEIGPGTGQATIPLARLGHKITAIELGPEMALLAKRELSEYKNVEIITGAFEEVELPRNTFDLVYSATAFHWIKPEMRFVKPHKILKDTGHLALIHTHHIRDDRNSDFYQASRPIYARCERPENSTLKHPKSPLLIEIQPDYVDKKLFTHIFFNVYGVTFTYTSNEYVGAISTYSRTLAMQQTAREAFLRELGELIDRKFHGTIEKHYGFSLTLARKN